MRYLTKARRGQRRAADGFVTLSLSALLLTLLVLTSLYAAQFKLQEQRILANHQRVQLAGMIARAALTKATFQLLTGRDPAQLSAAGMIADGRYEVSWQQSGSMGQLTAVGFAPGDAVDAAIKQRAQAQVFLTSLLQQAPQQPVLVRGGVTVEGTALLEQRPEDSVPYERVISTDLLSYLFVKPPRIESADTPAGQLHELRALADLETTRCGDLSTTTAGFIWVDGDCQLASRQQLGQPDHPVILVVANGQLELGHQAQVYGLVVSLAQQPSVLISDSGAIHGALWANHGLQLVGDKLTVTLTSSMQHWLMQHLALRRAFVIPGSWHYGPL